MPNATVVSPDNHIGTMLSAATGHESLNRYRTYRRVHFVSSDSYGTRIHRLYESDYSLVIVCSTYYACDEKNHVSPKKNILSFPSNGIISIGIAALKASTNLYLFRLPPLPPKYPKRD